MILVIDTNILLSALIRDSATRKIIIKSEWEFYYPETALHEVRKYQRLVIEKSGISEAEYNALLDLLLKHIILIPEEQLLKYNKDANKLIGKIDADDAVFLAAAMSINDSKIWSNDPHLHMQKKIKAFKTEEILRILS